MEHEVREDEAGFGEGTPQQVSREGQNRRIADFGTVVETCSKKVAASSVWAFADTFDGEGGASANFAAYFSLYYLLRTAREIWQSFPENLFVFS